MALRRLRRRHGGSDRRHPAHHARPRAHGRASQRVPRRALGRAEQRRGTASATGYRGVGGREEREVRARVRRLRHLAVPGLRDDLATTDRRFALRRATAAVPVALALTTEVSRARASTLSAAESIAGIICLVIAWRTRRTSPELGAVLAVVPFAAPSRS